jgi:hypothetical protein
MGRPFTFADPNGQRVSREFVVVGTRSFPLFGRAGVADNEGMKLPAALQPIFDQLYGPDSPYRIYSFLLTACVVMWFPKPTRRFGGIAFFVILVVMVVILWLKDVMISFTPQK